MLKAAASVADANTAGRDAAVAAVLPDKDTRHQTVALNPVQISLNQCFKG